MDDKNYRPTQRLAVVQDANSTGSESVFDPLDQLYMTSLSSAPRGSQLIPILCAIVNFNVSLRQIDQLFQFAEGETRLPLRGLHSLLSLDDDYGISSHHASFLDFLNNLGRSGTFCVGTLQHRIDLARIILQAYVGPHEEPIGFWSQNQRGELVLSSRLATRDVALQCIRKMVKNQLDMGGQVYSWETRAAALESIGRHQIADDTKGEILKHTHEQRKLVDAISYKSYLVRLSLPCPVLYRELWCIPIVPIMEYPWSSGSLFIHHISKWLEVRHGLNIRQQLLTKSFRFVRSFPNPTPELIAFWNQALGKLNSIPLDGHDLEYAENEWGDMINHWKRTIVRLQLPDDLKFPLPI
ncbi:hypothetical protein C8R45DRAFT_1174081 [Mycena sanguinolenta]|nr:hypothetical protein C8R45DRAFT_1174081 [Mycena sanguinolenta]